MKDHNLAPALVEDPYPLQKHLGFYLTDWSEGFARFELPVKGFLMNRYGILHGGIHGVMADTVMGFCGCYTGDPENRELAMTLNLSVNYVGPLKGKLLIALGYYEEALRIDPDHVLTREYLGEAHLQMGDVASAKQELGEIEKRAGRDSAEYAELSRQIAAYEAANG